MIFTKAEFYSGTKGQLFRLVRTPKKVYAHLLFISPLFEQANQTRHHLTRSAINAYHQGIESIIFDHFGTGDSQGELIHASVSLWQQDILEQINKIKVDSAQDIIISLPLSAALLLSSEILQQVDVVMLLQSDFNGKRFVQQFKRLALVNNLTQATKSTATKKSAQSKNEKITFDIAGYEIADTLFDDLTKQNIAALDKCQASCYWFEWLKSEDKISPGRIKQQQAFAQKMAQLDMLSIADKKFWQATELQLADDYLAQERQVFAQLVKGLIIDA